MNYIHEQVVQKIMYPHSCCYQINRETTFGVLCYRLTRKGFSNYSALMEAELKSLEEKINQFVQLCHRQRTENIQLRQQLAGATSENKHLSEKINAATNRLETLLAQFPGNK